jgi:hypothetical protein
MRSSLGPPTKEAQNATLPLPLRIQLLEQKRDAVKEKADKVQQEITRLLRLYSSHSALCDPES